MTWVIYLCEAEACPLGFDNDEAAQTLPRTEVFGISSARVTAATVQKCLKPQNIVEITKLLNES